MSQELLIVLHPQPTPSATVFDLQVNEALAIEVQVAGHPVGLPQITQVTLSPGGADSVSFGPSSAGLPAGIQWTFLVLRHIGAPGLTECTLLIEGTCQVSGVTQNWTAPEVTLNLQETILPPASGGTPVNDLAQQFLLGLFLNNGNLTSISNQQQFQLPTGQSLVLNVCGDPAFQTSEPSLVMVTLSTVEGAPLAMIRWGEDEVIPAGFIMPSIAFRNNGEFPSSPTTYSVGLGGIVQIQNAPPGTWMQEPELILMTSAGPGHPMDTPEKESPA